MSPHGIFPLQVVDLVIGELADAHEQQIRVFSHRYIGPCKTLRSCALASKKWADRSRARLFEKVKVEVREGRPTLLPPPSILPYVKKLEVVCSKQPFAYRPPYEASTPDLLKAFLAAPVERLRITEGALANQRVCIQEFIDAHSTTLQTVEFKCCSLSAYNISDIVLGNRCIKRLHLADCKSEHLSLGHTDTPDPGTCSKAAELELYISGEDWEEGPLYMAIMVAQLPYRFRKLEIDHFPTEESPEAMTATSGLIKANADTLSSLRIHINAEDVGIEIEPQHLPSLDGCSNLSELTLDMEWSSCSFNDCISILSTLDPARSSRLGKIMLEVSYLGWFNKDGPVEDKEDEDELDDERPAGRKKGWERLDAVLSDLAEAATHPRDKRLTFTLVVLRRGNNRELMPIVRKWLPKLLPRFNELGLLHVHYVWGSRCRTVDDARLSHEKPECLAEGFKDSY